MLACMNELLFGKQQAMEPRTYNHQYYKANFKSIPVTKQSAEIDSSPAASIMETICFKRVLAMVLFLLSIKLQPVV